MRFKIFKIGRVGNKPDGLYLSKKPLMNNIFILISS